MKHEDFTGISPFAYESKTTSINLRPVEAYGYLRLKKIARNGNRTPLHKRKIGDGLFHEFGSDYEEFETGPGNYSTAIVEMPNGQVISVSVDLIQFQDNQE